MPISIEVKEDSKVILLKGVREDVGSKLVPFAFLNQKASIEAGITEYITRVPVSESSGTEMGPASVTEAREAIPAREAMGRGLDGYIIASLPEGQGGTVNGRNVEAGILIEDRGIIFEAS